MTGTTQEGKKESRGGEGRRKADYGKRPGWEGLHSAHHDASSPHGEFVGLLSRPRRNRPFFFFLFRRFPPLPILPTLTSSPCSSLLSSYAVYGHSVDVSTLFPFVGALSPVVSLPREAQSEFLIRRTLSSRTAMATCRFLPAHATAEARLSGTETVVLS